MKTTKNFIIAAVCIGIISISSCKKDVELQKENPIVPGSATSFKEMKVNTAFNWKSAHVVALKVEAANAPIKITNTLIVKTESGDIIFKKLQNMNDSYTGALTLPTSIKKVIINFGSITKTVDIVGSTINFNFITESIQVD